MGPRGGLDVSGKRKPLDPFGIRTKERPARSLVPKLGRVQIRYFPSARVDKYFNSKIRWSYLQALTEIFGVTKNDFRNFLSIFNENTTVSARKSHSAGKQSKSSVCKYKEGKSSFANKGTTESLVLKRLQSSLGRILHLDQPSKFVCQHTQYSVTTKDISNNVRLRTPDDGQKGCPKHVES